MSNPDADVRAVLSHFKTMLGSDGSTVQLHSIDGEVLRVKYQSGECDSCALAPEDLVGMMEELLVRRKSTITKVELAS